MPAMIDPSKPTREEVAAHNMKVAKANFASDLAGKLCGALPLIPGVYISQGAEENTPARLMTAKEVADFAISIAETIIETYSMMPDASGNRGGLVA